MHCTFSNLVKGDHREKYVLCADRAGKEQAMLQRQLEKFMAGIEKKNSLLADSPSKKTQSIRIRVVSKPEKELSVLLSRMKLLASSTR